MRRYSSDKTWPEFAEKIAADCPDLNTESFDSDFINSFTGTIEPVRIRPMALWPEILKKLDNCERQKAEEKLKMKFKAGFINKIKA